MQKYYSKLPPSILALLIQALAVFLTYMTLTVMGWQLGALFAALICGVYAATLSRLIGLAKWWVWISLLFAPALVMALSLDIEPIWFLLAFIIMLLVYWSAFRTQVPLYLSSLKVWQSLAGLLPTDASSTHYKFIDLGSGLGGVLTYLGRVKPEGHYSGVEYAPLPFVWSWLRIKLASLNNCQVQWGSLWDVDLSQYDVVFAYLSPVPMEDLWHKARKEMRPGTMFISSTFGVAEHPPCQSIQIDDLHRSTLYVWQM